MADFAVFDVSARSGVTNHSLIVADRAIIQLNKLAVSLDRTGFPDSEKVFGRIEIVSIAGGIERVLASAGIGGGKSSANISALTRFLGWRYDDEGNPVFDDTQGDIIARISAFDGVAIPRKLELVTDYQQLAAPKQHHSVAVESTGGGVSFSSIAGSVNWTDTASGSDRAVYIIGGNFSSSPSGNTATYDGVAMTKVSSQLCTANSFSNAAVSDVFRLVNQNTTSNAVNDVALSGGANSGAFGNINLSGVDQGTPEGTIVKNTGTGDASVGSVTCPANGILIASAWVNTSSTTTAFTNGTKVFASAGTNSGGNDFYIGAGGFAAVTANIVVDVTTAGAPFDNWAMNVVPVNAAASGSSDTPITPTVGSITFTGVAARNDRGLIGALGALTLTGVAGSAVHSTMLTSVVGALVLTGVASSPVQGRMITTQVGQLTLPELATFGSDRPVSVMPLSGHTLGPGTMSEDPGSARATLSRNSGSLFCEFTVSGTMGGDNVALLGIGTNALTVTTVPALFWTQPNSFAFRTDGQNVSGDAGGGSYGANLSSGQVVGMLLAFNSAGLGTLTYYINGVSQGVAYSGIPANTYYPMIGIVANNISVTFNFGDTAFAYTQPAGSTRWTVFNNPRMNFGQILTTGSLTLTGFAPTFPGGTSITPDVGTIVIAGVAPRLDLTIIGAAGAILLSGVAPYTDYKLTTIVGALTLLGYTVTQNFGIVGAVGSLSLTGVASSPVQGMVLTPQSGSASITGIAGRMDRGIILSVGSLSIVGGISTIQLVMSNTPITPSAGVLAIVGGSPEAVVFLSPEATSIFIISRKTNTWILDRKTNQLVI